MKISEIISVPNLNGYRDQEETSVWVRLAVSCWPRNWGQVATLEWFRHLQNHAQSHAQPEQRPSSPHWLSLFTGVFVRVNGETTFLNLQTAFYSAVIRLAFFKKKNLSGVEHCRWSRDFGCHQLILQQGFLAGKLPEGNKNNLGIRAGHCEKIKISFL